MGRKNQAYEYLKKAIIENEYPPGTPLREMDLSTTLNMSRSPIREALRELEVEGVIISYPSRGSIVTPITPYDVEEIYELRVLHELWALEKGFHRITDEDLTTLSNSFKKAYDAKDWELLHHADIHLHGMIIEKSGSKRLAAFVNTLNTQIERIRRFSTRDSDRIRLSYQEHMKIIELLLKRDLTLCREALREHLRSVANSAIDASRVIDITTKL